MEEVVLEKNPSGLKIYVNGKPDIDQLEKKDKENEMAHLEIQIMVLFKKKRTKNKTSDSL